MSTQTQRRAPEVGDEVELEPGGERFVVTDIGSEDGLCTLRGRGRGGIPEEDPVDPDALTVVRTRAERRGSAW
ncbi:hypothetical protein GCM10027160_23160 [Streptomyces calidiresistens]|uniref:Uncharacterized protein n=1 Tax=Streptomyces calidiresistens TaxID=1485586 RepID=A0A7W3T731_9ACTN|nr:hypothetical protein [Streptomyces calidiresistens]MBB0232157.1 hypothetical protein [Streptomyces calidiresistens]